MLIGYDYIYANRMNTNICFQTHAREILLQNGAEHVEMFALGKAI